MAEETGVPAIKRLIISLLVIGAITCGAIYAILSPPKPIIKPVASLTPSRTLAYQQQIVRPGEPATAATPDAQTPQQQPLVPSKAAPAKPTPAAGAPAQNAPAPQPQAASPAGPDNSAHQQGMPPDMAGLPPDDETEPYDPDALPWQQRGQRPDHPGMQGEGPDYPDAPGEDGYAPGPMGAMPGEDGYPPEGGEAWPGEDADPNAWPAGPQEPPQEWVQVLVSGAGMHGIAAEDAPMLFAFPYGRTLRVISRYGNWVEVTDPQSATTGWMKAQYLAPVAQPRPHQEAEQWYEEEPPRRRRGWLRRNGGGIADMLDRALGGGY
jgi:hypothetical protein